MGELTSFNPAWLDWIAPERFNDAELFRIVTFFVFHSPCPNLAAMGKSLSEYGWNKPWQKPYYLNRHLKRAASNYELIYSAKGYKEMKAALQKADMLNFPTDFRRERICIYNKYSNQFMSVFFHLRNAFAHSRLNMVDVDGECVFVLEDVTPKQIAGQHQVSARMILRKSTLLKWIDLIEGGEREYIRNVNK